MTDRETSTKAAKVMTSPRGPSSTASSRHRGHQWWRRDVHHLVVDGRTLCGKSAADWLDMSDAMEPSAAAASENCCTVCAKRWRP